MQQIPDVCCTFVEVSVVCVAIEKAEPDHYAKLQTPSENIYSEAFYGDTALLTKPGTFLFKKCLSSVYYITKMPGK